VSKKLKKFVQVDQAGAEALIVAYCAKPGNYRRLFEQNIKVHTYVAAHVFKDVWASKMLEHRLITSVNDFNIQEMLDAPIEQVKQFPQWKPLADLIKSSDDWSVNERYYFLGKQIAHSSNYGVGPGMFRMNTLEKSGGKVVIGKEDSETFLLTYHALFPEVQSYHRWIQRTVDANHVLYNLHNHPYQITHYEIQDSQWKELYSWIPQSSVGEITTIAYTRMQQFIEIGGRTNTITSLPKTGKEVTEALDTYFIGGNRSAICFIDNLANTHDSFLTQTLEEQETETAKVMQFFIQQSFISPIDGAPFQMQSEAVSGWNWRPAKFDNATKEWINPRGLRPIKGLC
jgi:hypothetical protein